LRDERELDSWDSWEEGGESDESSKAPELLSLRRMIFLVFYDEHKIF